MSNEHSRLDETADSAITRARARADEERRIGDLTDAANIAAGTLTVTRGMADLAATVSEAVEMFHPLAVERRVGLEAAIESPLRRAFFDPARIYQVITNLLSNAIKFTPSGGTVKVRVYSAAGELCVAVSDTGIGIAPEQVTAVFARNVQLAKSDRCGTGLGLYISRSIVLRHGGRIWAEGRPGEGSTFFFTVPMTPDPLIPEPWIPRERNQA